MRRQLFLRDWAFFAVLVVMLIVGSLIFAPFLPAILWAVVLSILTYPVFERTKKRLSGGRLTGFAPSGAALVAILFTIGVILIPLAAVGLGLFLQTQGIASSAGTATDQNFVQSFLTQLDTQIKPLAAQFGAKEFSATGYWDQNRDQIISGLRSPAAAAAQKAGVAAVMAVVALLTQFFMLRDGHRIRPYVLDIEPIPREKSEALLHRLYEPVWAVFVGTVLVAMLQGTAIGIAFAVVGVPNAVVLGVIAFLLCIVPLLGSPVIYVPVAIGLFLQGNTTGALGILAFGFLIVSNIDNALRPFLIGGRTNLHPMIIFFSILGGVLLFGPVGVMAGPMLITIVLTLVEVLRERMQMHDASESATMPAITEMTVIETS
jgi:predicted PurR-regulated permease PerM